jgi:SAM-dependent methyltransferase
MTERIEPGALAPVLRQTSFSGRQEGARQFTDQVLPLLPSGDTLRLLDLGTGSGDVALLIHEARPLAQVTGIDFSQVNHAAAQARPAGAGVNFVCADYLEWQGGTFGLIVADSVLHLIEAPVARIAAKLAADLAPGGLVVATVPDAGVINRCQLQLRRLWRRTPVAIDRLVLALAARLHPDMSRQELLDRLPYLRLMPVLFGASELREFAAAGLTLFRNEPWPSPSLVKPRHRLMVWRRDA